MTGERYQAFVSYSHDADKKLAESLQSSLDRFARPWYRLHGMRIFRDATGLSANPELWNSIEDALGNSEYFLLMACPASAQSVWVQKEIQWWLKNRSSQKILICLTEGVILWDGRTNDFDWAKTTSISLSLKGAFAEEPLYADFRAAKTSGRCNDSDVEYRTALLNVAAPLLGRPKDELDSEDIRLHRKAEITAWTVAVFIICLGIFAGASMFMARQRQKIAVSRALASEATSHVDDRTLALLLSLEARRIADTVESRRSLLTALQRVPHAEAYLWGHNDAVTKAVYSPDGKTVLSAGWDNRIIQWNAATYEVIGTPLSTPKGLVSIAFNPEGSQFALAAIGSIQVRDAGSQHRLVETLNYEKEGFDHVAFSSDGKLVAASSEAYGGHPFRVFVWSLETRQLVGAPMEGQNFAFSPDSHLLAIAYYEDVLLYDLHSRRLIKQPLKGHSKNISSIAFSPDGTMVAAGSEDNSIVLWEVKSRAPVGTLTGHSATVTTLVFDRENSVLLSGGADGTIFRWNLEDLTAFDAPIKTFGASISSIFLAPDGHVKSVAIERERAIVLDVNDDPALGRRIRSAGVNSSNLSFSPDGSSLASSGDFGDVLIWDVASGALRYTPLSGHERQVSSLAYAPSGKQLVSGSMDGTVIFWDTEKGTALGPPTKAHWSPVWSLACSPNGKAAVSGGDSQLIFWDMATGKQAGAPLTSEKDRIWTLAFSPTGEFLAAAKNNRTAAILKTGDRRVVKTLGSPLTGDDWELMPAGVRFSPDGTLVATTAKENSVTIWDFTTGRAIAPGLYGHSESVASVSFRADGKVLASGSADGDIRLWDVATHELIGTLSPEQKAIKSVVFSPQKGTLASVGEEESIVFWDVDFEDWSHRACRIANRNLTPKEWNTYLGSVPYRKTCGELP